MALAFADAPRIGFVGGADRQRVVIHHREVGLGGKPEQIEKLQAAARAVDLPVGQVVGGQGAQGSLAGRIEVHERAVVFQRQHGVIGVLRIQIGQLQARGQSLGVEAHRLFKGGDASRKVALGEGVAQLFPKQSPAAFGRRIVRRGQPWQQALKRGRDAGRLSRLFVGGAQVVQRRLVRRVVLEDLFQHIGGVGKVADFHLQLGHFSPAPGPLAGIFHSAGDPLRGGDGIAHGAVATLQVEQLFQQRDMGRDDRLHHRGSVEIGGARRVLVAQGQLQIPDLLEDLDLLLLIGGRLGHPAQRARRFELVAALDSEIGKRAQGLRVARGEAQGCFVQGRRALGAA